MSVVDTTSERVTFVECSRVLSSIPFLALLSEEDIESLAPLANIRNYVAGSTIFHEDDLADAVYFIASGAVEVFKSDHTGKKLPLTILRDSGVLGEMGLLNSSPRSATARTLSTARVLCFESKDFYEALASGVLPAYRLVLAFARVLSQRLSIMDEKLFVLFEQDSRDNQQDSEMIELKRRLLTTWTV